MPQKQQQQEEPYDPWKYLKVAFHRIVWLCASHQRGLIVITRKNFGKSALGIPAVYGLLLIFVWTGASKDPFMSVWVIFWLLFLVKRRFETWRMAKAGIRVHSHYDGWPRIAMLFCRTEGTARLVVEPLMIAILGCILLVVYEKNRLP